MTRLICDTCGAEVIIDEKYIPQEHQISNCPVCGGDEIILDEDC